MPSSKSYRRSEDRALYLAQANWRALHPNLKYAAICHAAVELAKDRYRGLPDNVTGVGFGPRRKRQQSGSRYKPRVLHHDPCLVVLVDEKLSPSALSTKRKLHAVPPHVVMNIPYGRRSKIKVAIPTDVVQHPRVPKAQHLIGIEVTDPDHPQTLQGSVAAQVRFATAPAGARYLLTCHHVAYPSLDDADDGTSTPPEVDALPNHENIGVTSRGAYFGYNVGPCVDAAIIRLSPNLPDSVIAPPLQPVGFISTSSQMLAELPAGVWLYSKHHPGGTPIRYMSNYVDFSVEYESGDLATIVEVMEYELEAGASQGGDSGGALVSGNGILLGMHIAGDGQTGYAIPAYKILMASAFNPRITLV